MKFPNLKKYDNFDEFIKRNDIEVLSFNDGIAARWKSSRRYKSWGHRVRCYSICTQNDVRIL